MIGEHRVNTFGLTKAQNDFVRKCLPMSDYQLLDTDCPTELIVFNASTTIINPATMSQDDMEMLFSYYEEIGCCTDETIIWLGEPKPPVKLNKIFKSYDDFSSIEEKLKYILLSAHSKRKKSAGYSKKLANGIKILSLIRQNPGIKTAELAESTELTQRSVQRIIVSLQAAGEWIEYDTKKRGWKLFHDISILFGDV